MAVSNAAVKELQTLCGLEAKAAKAALAKHGGDVQAALGALIDSGKVQSRDLHPDLASDEMYERAAQQGRLGMYRAMESPAGLLGMMRRAAGKDESDDGEAGGFLNTMAGLMTQLHAEKFGGKSAEEMMAEDDAKAAKDRAKLNKVLGVPKGWKPPSGGQQARTFNRIRRRGDALKANPVTLKLPPFPPLKLTLSEWVGKGLLKAWAGTQERHGGYTSRSSDKPSKGSVVIQINRPREDEDDVHPLPPSPEQVAAYAHLKDNDAAVAEAVMKALVANYKKTRKRWLKHDPDLDLPEINTPEEMRKHVGLGTLHMHDHAKGGMAYYGLELGCTWDEEHGAGVTLHGSRVLAVGQADTSFATDAVQKDGGKPIQRKAKATAKKKVVKRAAKNAKA